ncbi:unnamed protein product [Clonostachys rosea]|uniref:Heterokaryon incompatibility domain-containing protein n=1 Tax=Bionectria ochroleuca TaxID=29856 RepID=A0ABY6U043_BIOOC|nr:unnamed protein product [Clonostachys rosea]
MEIRLLEILPSSSGSEDEQVSCRLFKAPLTSKKLHYAALSYVWGDPNVTERVTINGSMKNVTTNLASALKRFRNSKEKTSGDKIVGDKSSAPLPLWVDAVCINQDDTEERNHQVTHMSVIYSNAAYVLSWFGEPKPGDTGMNLCFEFVHGLAKALGNDLNSISMRLPLEQVKTGFNWITNQPDLCCTQSSPDTKNIYWYSLFSLLQSDYWNRIWIAQEIALARSFEVVICICGNEQMIYRLQRLSQGIKIL